MRSAAENYNGAPSSCPLTGICKTFTARRKTQCNPFMDQPFSFPVSHFGDFELTAWNHITGL